VTPWYERAVVTDLGGFADHNAHAVIDEEPATYLRSGMYLDSGQPAGQVRQETGKPFQLPAPQPVRRPVQQQGVETGVAGYDLPVVRAAGSRSKTTATSSRI
jgi:hypothetical protein